MNCEYCSSGISGKDNVCSRCGAPNEEYCEHDNENGNSSQPFGEFIRQIENTEPATYYHESLFEKYISAPLKNYISYSNWLEISET
jgi:predicted amidophosphoribosyltransferase